MKPVLLNKNGFNIRAIKCEHCGEAIIHPNDKQEYDNFMRLKNKEFEVKMRMVGNSYAVSIPREIVDFMKDQETLINNMVKLSFQEAGKLNLMFNCPECNEDNNISNQNNNPNLRSRVVSSKEVRIVKDGKPIMHTRKFYDSANPKNNKTIILKRNQDKEINQEEEN